MLGNEVEIACSFGKHLFGAGDIVSALIQSGGHISKGKLYAQAYGHIFVDQKWLQRDYGLSFTKKTSTEVFETVAAPPKQQSVNNLTPYCVYITPKDEINASTLAEEGVIIQFHLPMDVFPTFHGMVCSISYYIALFWEDQEVATAAYFPFRVSGCGSSFEKQLIRYESIYWFCRFFMRSII